MKKFNIYCKDNVTGMRMMLSECSYNMACDYLDHCKDIFGEFIRLKKIEHTNDITELIFEKGKFWYDETRGYLLRA